MGIWALMAGVWWKWQLPASFRSSREEGCLCFVCGHEVLGEFAQPCVGVRSLVLLNLFLFDCEGWILPLPRGHCCERWECGLLSILDSQVHIKHRAKQVLPSSKYLRHVRFKLRHSLFAIKAIIEFRQRSDEDEAFMYSKSSWSNFSRHCVTARLVSLLVLRTLHLTFESSMELVCRSSMHLMAGVLGFQSLHVTMTDSVSWLCMRQLHSQMGRIQEEKGRLHFMIWHNWHILTHVSISTKKVVLWVWMSLTGFVVIKLDAFWTHPVWITGTACRRRGGGLGGFVVKFADLSIQNLEP